MDAKVALFLNVSFIFAMLVAASGEAPQYPSIPCNVAPSPWYDLKPCQERLTTVCRDDIFNYIFQQHETVKKECCIELVKMGRWCHNHLTFATIRNFVERVPELEERGDRVWELCERQSGIWMPKVFYRVLNEMFNFVSRYCIFCKTWKHINVPHIVVNYSFSVSIICLA